MREVIVGLVACGYASYKFYRYNDTVHMVLMAMCATVFLARLISEMIIMYEERPRPKKRKKKKNLVIKRLIIYLVAAFLVIGAFAGARYYGIEIPSYVMVSVFVLTGVITILIAGDE